MSQTWSQSSYGSMNIGILNMNVSSQRPIVQQKRPRKESNVNRRTANIPTGTIAAKRPKYNEIPAECEVRWKKCEEEKPTPVNTSDSKHKYNRFDYSSVLAGRIIGIEIAKLKHFLGLMNIPRPPSDDIHTRFRRIL